MAWNTGKSILDTGDTGQDVEREADVIFSAAFIGMTLFQNKKREGLTWRIDMEPNTDPLGQRMPDRNARTKDDRDSMRTLNDVCSKVNQVIRTSLGKDVGGVGWGLTPTFDRGGMICAGESAQGEYAQVNPAYAKTAYRYLTAPQQASNSDQRAQEMYIGRGAYCGLVVDDRGDAVTAMSTICTALNEDTPGVGERWRPAADAAVRAAQYKEGAADATWGVIGSAGLQETLRQQGMRFYPQEDGVPVPLNKTTDVVGYTHGMIRCIYETERIGQGTAFEMSIGTDTFKLASCLACSSFMMANGVDASSSHLGRGESWAPYYSGESHNASYLGDKLKGGINKAIEVCNGRYAAFMHHSLINGAQAMEKSPSWVEENHRPALAALLKKLKTSTEKNTVARDLFLDAMTYHKGDAKRLNDALTYGDSARRFCDGTYDWCQNRQTNNETKGTWETFVNPHTDKEIRALHTAPIPLGKKLKIWSPHKEDSCALEYSLANPDGVEVLKGTATQGPDEEHAATGYVSLTATTGDVANWKIKFAGDREYHRIRTTGSVAIGSGSRYSYRFTES